MHARIAVLAAALALLPSLAAAQHRPRPVLSEGDYVRVYTQDARSLKGEGVVAGFEPGAILFASTGPDRTVSAGVEPNDLLAIRYPARPVQRTRKGGFLGAFIGASLGGIVTPFIAAAAGSGGGGFDFRTAGFGAAGGALAGGAVGAVAGYFVPQHRWRYVRVPYGFGEPEM